MLYVFDTSSFIVVGHYFPNRFPSFWERFDKAVADGEIVSTREVDLELDRECTRLHLREWLTKHHELFTIPTSAETNFVAKIFAIAHFRQLVAQKQRLKGSPVADPFVIACASVRNGCVVTEEMTKGNAAKIPNVCKHFSVPCINIEGFMEAEKWRF